MNTTINSHSNPKKISFIFILIFTVSLIYNFSFLYRLFIIISPEFFYNSFYLFLAATIISSIMITIIPLLFIKKAISSLTYNFKYDFSFIKTLLFNFSIVLICSLISQAILETLFEIIKINHEIHVSIVFIYATIISILYYLINYFIIKNFRILSDFYFSYKEESKVYSKKIARGMIGEKNVKFELEFLEHDKKDFYKVINNRRYKNNDIYAEIDHIVISSKGVFLLETKNYASHLKITKENKWLYKTYKDNKFRQMHNVTRQVTRHHLVIENILHDTKYKDIPIYDIIVMANENQIIEGIENSKYKIVNINNLIDEIKNFTENNVLDATEIAEINEILFNSSEEYSRPKDNRFFKQLFKELVFYKFAVSTFILLFIFSLSANKIFFTNLSNDMNTKKIDIGKITLEEFVKDYLSNEVNLNVLAEKVEKQKIDSPVLIFRVGEHPGAKGTYIYVKHIESDKFKIVFDGIFKEGTEVKFYKKDRQVVIEAPNSEPKKYELNSDIIELKVANHFTEIIHNDQSYKNLYVFKYDFEKDELIR